MKPKTQLEKEVYRLSKRLPNLTDTQKTALKKNANPATAYHTKHQQWCLSCGHVMSVGEKKCPHCGRVFTEIVESYRRTDDIRNYATIHTTFKGFQVARHFVVWRWSNKGKESSYQINEAMQEWISAKGEKTIMAHPVAMCGMYYDVWTFSIPMSIKKANKWSYASQKRYDIYAEYNRWESLLPILKRNGATRKDIGIRPSLLYESLLKDNIAEELLKTGQTQLLHRRLKGSKDIPMHAVRICNRNGYIVQNADEWCDYIHMCDQLGIDTHNAHYVCPANLTQAHDKVNDKLQNNAKEQLNKETARLYEKIYKKMKAKFMGIFFGNEDISIQVAQSVEDIRKEGKAMHHCVFAMGYYKREDDLILFARDKKTGARLETIRINLRSFKVVESRGVCNDPSPRHDEIVQLCNNNMHLIREAA